MCSGKVLWMLKVLHVTTDVYLMAGKLGHCRETVIGRGYKRSGKTKLTCSERCLERRKNPSRHPITTAKTDKMRRPFCWHTFLTRLHTAPNAMVTRPLPAQLAIQTPFYTRTHKPSKGTKRNAHAEKRQQEGRAGCRKGDNEGPSKKKHLSIHRWSLLKPITLSGY